MFLRIVFPSCSRQVLVVGMIPVKDNVGDPVSWRYTDQIRKGDVLYGGAEEEDATALRMRRGAEEEKKEEAALFRLIRIFIHKPENVTLGCSIYCGSDTRLVKCGVLRLVAPIFVSLFKVSSKYLTVHCMSFV